MARYRTVRESVKKRITVRHTTHVALVHRRLSHSKHTGAARAAKVTKIKVTKPKKVKLT